MAKKSAFEEVEKSLLDFLDKLEMSKRLEVVDNLIHRLNFERRFMLLTDEEREHMLNEELSPKERKWLDNVKSDPKAFEERIQSYTRSRYFRRMAWTAYLNGDNDEKPFSSPPKKDYG